MRNEGPYADVKYAVEEFQRSQEFEVYVKAEFTSKHVKRLQSMLRERFYINVPDDFAVAMLTADPDIATDAKDNCLHDTDCREMVASYLAEYLCNASWPCNGTPEEESKDFFDRYAEQIKLRGWQLPEPALT